MDNRFSRLSEDAKKEITSIKKEVQKKSGVEPSESEVIEGLLEAVDKQSAARFAHEKRSQKKKRKRSKNKSEFDELFSL